MLENLKKNETFEYQKLSQEEMKAKGILGRLVGPCADFMNPTRNGRKYGEQLWDNAFDNPIMQEKIRNGVCFGELGHPADRTETDMEKIAICLREQPKKNSDGLLMACFDILDTPNGRILKTLCDYGTTIGISSRGTGDIISDDEGNDVVDPDTYEFECFDAVLVPAVETARMTYVTESLDKNNAKLSRALCENLKKANANERKVMEETLSNLNIKLDEQKEESIPEEGGDKLAESKSSEQTIEKTEEANNDGSDEIIKSLQEALKKNSELEASVKSLQEQLAVSDAKADKLEEDLVKYKATTVRLSTDATKTKELESKVSTLEEELKANAKTIESQKLRISKLLESKKSAAEDETKTLKESLTSKDAEIKSLNENFDEIKSDYEHKIKELTENYATLKSDSESKDKEYCSQIAKETKLKEQYQSLATKFADKYIESRATTLGIRAEDIKKKLPKSYTSEDIDSICEDLQSYELNISKLPFNVDRKVKVKVHESKNEMLHRRNDDDEIDDSLLNMAHIPH